MLAKDIDVPINLSKMTELEPLPEVLGVLLDNDDDDSMLPGNDEPNVQPEMLDVMLDGAGSVQPKMLGEMLDVMLDDAGPVQPKMLDEMLDVVVDGVGSVQPEIHDVVLDDAGHVQHKMLDNVVDRDVNAHDGDINEHAAEVWASFMSNIRSDGNDAQRLYG